MKTDPGESRLISTRELQNRRVNEVFYPARMRQKCHRHNLPALSFVASGQYQECIGRQTYSRRVSTLIYHPADEKHAVAFESDVRILSVEFRTNVSSTEDSLNRGSSHCSELIAWLGVRLRCEMTRSDSASSLAIDGLIAELLAEGSRGKVLTGEKSTARWLGRATEFVHDNFRTALSLEESRSSRGRSYRTPFTGFSPKNGLYGRRVSASVEI
jgi:hypothetical protein